MRENQNPGSEPLPERCAEVLRGVVEAYFSTGVPVGSRAVVERWTANRKSDAPSSATIRHLCGTLEQSGYLAQPHTSAGRVPTAKAICWWLQGLEAPQPLAGQASHRFTQALMAAGDEARLWQLTSEFLADITGQLGLVVVQPWRDRGLRQLRFFRLTEHRVLAILVASDGQVRERVSRLPETFSQLELDDAARYINANFSGLTLARIRRELLNRVEEERAAYNALLKRVLVLSHCGVFEQHDQGQIFIEGASHLAATLHGEQLGEMLERLNQKERWAHLLNQVGSGGEDTVSWQAGPLGDAAVLPQRWIHARVGLAAEAMPEFSIISTNCHQGTVAILGPQRMPYAMALGAVSLAGEVLHKVLGDASA